MIKLLQGDCRAILPTLPDESVHCVVTSPPYWGLRDYGTATWEGGDANCEHTAVRRNHGDEKQATSNGTSRDRIVGTDCRLCGARRTDSQIGLEPSYTDYVAEMVGVFREVRRVLRKDGTLWLNLGDSYAANRSAQVVDNMRKFVGNDLAMSVPVGLKPKDLVGIPWRVAFALQADGWWLRQDIIWSKPNPMPESVTDRCTRAHEYIFLLSKSERYYYDAEAIAEPASDTPGAQAWRRIFDPSKQTKEAAMKSQGIKGGNGGSRAGRFGTRNKRSVWEVATQPYSEAHFATFPPALIEPCILAGCPVGGTVLDPFGGAGTTGLVADRLQRNATLIELNPAYTDMMEQRIRSDAGMFLAVGT